MTAYKKLARNSRKLTIAASAFLALTTQAFAAVTYHTVAVTGDPAPGFEGLTFAAFTTPLSHHIMAPRIDEDGKVAIIGVVAPGDSMGQSGIWHELGGTLSLAVRTGQHAPGTPEGVIFAGVPSDYIPIPPVVRDGQLGFGAALAGAGVDSGNDGGAWVHDGTGINLIAREGNAAPGTSAIFGIVPQPAVGNDGLVAPIARLTGDGVSESNDEGVWTNQGGALALVLREGEPAPGTPAGVVFGHGVFAHQAAFESVAVSHSARAVVQANLLGPGVDYDNDEGVFFKNSQTGDWQMLAREDDDAPGFPPGSDYGGGSVTAQFSFLATNTLGHVSFSARVGGTGNTNMMMFSNHRGTLEPIVIPGARTPGGEGTFGIFGPPVLNDAGRIAFRAGLSGTSGLSLFWDQDGDIEVIVRSGEVSSDGATITGIDFIAGYADSGWLAFAGPMDDPVIGYKYGLHVVSPSGELHKIVSTADQFDVRGDGSDIREVIRVIHGGVSEAGEVVFRLDFSDESSGHFTARVEDFLMGDMNCDGEVDTGDIASFALALTDAETYEDQNQLCSLQRADTNTDTTVDGRDVAGFVELLLP